MHWLKNKKKRGKALAVATDVADPEQVKKLVDTDVRHFGRIDVMANNAGLPSTGRKMQTSTKFCSGLSGRSIKFELIRF